MTAVPDPRDATADGGQFALPGTRCFRLRHGADGCAYDIAVATPDGVAPPAGWPAIVLLDAAGCFATCVEAMQRMSRRPDATGVSPTVVIGLSLAGHPPDKLHRQRHLTTPRATEANSGGAAAFLAFIEQQLLPLICQSVALDRRRQTLFGHSLAGYFVLWVLANHAHSFRSYAAISPSIWWDPEGLRAAFAAPLVRDRALLVCVGEWEDELPPWQRALPDSADVVARRNARRMHGHARELTERLRPLLGADRVQFRVLPEEDHASILSAAIPRALRLASKELG